MSSRPDLKLAYCDHPTAVDACRRWHFTGTAPKGKYVRYGIWEDGKFCGVVMFGSGATPQIGKNHGLDQITCCEMVRLALGPHATPTSRILGIAIRLLRKHSPGIRLIITFCDPDAGHYGGIYQATGWSYVGEQKTRVHLRIRGRLWHWRTVESKYKTHSLKWLRENIDPSADWVGWQRRWKYVLPLDDEIKQRITSILLPYPKKVDVIGRDVHDDCAQQA